MAHGPNNVISVDFKDSHFEFQVNQEFNQESYGFFRCHHWILHREKHEFRNQNLVFIYSRCGVKSEKRNFTSLTAILKMALYR